MTNFHVNYVGFFKLKNERKSPRDSKKKNRFVNILFICYYDVIQT